VLQLGIIKDVDTLLTNLHANVPVHTFELVEDEEVSSDEEADEAAADEQQADDKEQARQDDQSELQRRQQLQQEGGSAGPGLHGLRTGERPTSERGQTPGRPGLAAGMQTPAMHKQLVSPSLLGSGSNAHMARATGQCEEDMAEKRRGSTVGLGCHNGAATDCSGACAHCIPQTRRTWPRAPWRLRRCSWAR
jgi:hypothetical protein